MPPSEGKHLNSLEGAVDVCAHRGPSLLSALPCEWDVVPGVGVVGANVVVRVVVVLVDGLLDIRP